MIEELKIIFSQETYNDFINNEDSDIIKNIYSNFCQVDSQEYYNNMIIFFKNLEHYYLLFLKNNIFNSNNNDIIYSNIRKYKKYIHLQIRKIHDFYTYEIVPDVLTFIDNQEGNSILIKDISSYYDDYKKYFNDFSKEILFFLNKDEYSFFYDTIELLEILYNKFDDEIFFEDLSKQNILINNNEKYYLSDFFIKKLTYFFMIETNNPEEIVIEYNDLFINKFIFSPFKIK